MIDRISCPLVAVSTLIALVGCAESREARSDAAVAQHDAATCALAWLDEVPLLRNRTRFAAPALTGDRDGFLFVTTDREREGTLRSLPLVVVERIPARGEGSETRVLSFERPSERGQLFASSDDEGAGRFAAVNSASPSDECCRRDRSADELMWGRAPGSRFEVLRTALDPARGLAAVAIDDAPWIVAHGWERERTIGEGSFYPIGLEVLRVVDGAPSPVRPAPDPSRGEFFRSASIALAGGDAWVVTSGFYGGPPRVARNGWQGEIAEADWYGRFAIATDASGALLFAHERTGQPRLTRLEREGARTGATLPARVAPGASGIAVASAGARTVIAYVREDGAIEVTILDAELSVIASDTIGSDTIASADMSVPTLLVAAASEGTFAIAITPQSAGPDFDALDPVRLSRFRVACD